MHSEKFSVLRDVSLSKSYSFCCDEMSFKYLYYLAKWNFIVSVSGINNACLSTICHLPRLLPCTGRAGLGHCGPYWLDKKDKSYNSVKIPSDQLSQQPLF